MPPHRTVLDDHVHGWPHVLDHAQAQIEALEHAEISAATY
jgi:hypothetical protein